MIYWTDIIEEIVESVQTDTDKPVSLDSGAPYYMHGHPLELHTILEEKGHSSTLKFEKFPLIALIQDFDEENNRLGWVRVPAWEEIEPWLNEFKEMAKGKKNFIFIGI